MRNFLQYSGYFRASRYGKYLLSYTNVFLMKPSQDVLFALYQFDFELRKVMYEACAKAEIQIKSAISNAVSLKTDDAVFYLDKQNYTPTRSERNKSYRKRNVKFFNNFFSDIQDKEEKMRKDVLKYPELKEYRSGGKRASMNIPSWAAFSYFEFGTIENIYMYLRSDLRKEVLLYSYSRGKYGKKITMQMDAEDDTDILLNGEDFFSRLYALKKVMNPKDSEEMKSKLKKIISRAKIDVYQLDILPVDWEDRFDRIKYL